MTSRPLEMDLSPNMTAYLRNAIQLAIANIKLKRHHCETLPWEWHKENEQHINLLFERPHFIVAYRALRRRGLMKDGCHCLTPKAFAESIRLFPDIQREFEKL